jgi:hypothetical protein
MAGLITGNDPNTRDTALFGNLLINRTGAPTPKPAIFACRQTPIYKP